MRRSPRRFLGCAVLAGCTAFEWCVPASAEPVPTIAPTAPESPGHPDALLAVTGLVIFGVPYGASTYVAATSNVSSDQWLYAPIIGPWADLINRGGCTTTGCRGDVTSATLGLVMDGLFQAGGAVIIATTFLSPGKPPASAYARSSPPKPRTRIAPTGGRNGAGVALFGIF
jgi:hypothetical protein